MSQNIIENKEIILKLYNKGLTGKDIADCLNLNAHSITDFLYKELNLPKHLSVSAQKIVDNKDNIKQLLLDGRSNSYIGRILQIDRGLLRKYIKEWGFEKNYKFHFTPRIQKTYNKNKQIIYKLLQEKKTIQQIADILNERKGTINTIIQNTKEFKILLQENQIGVITKQYKDNRREIYKFNDLPNERWVEIQNKPNYFISDYGRIKHYLKSLDCFRLLELEENKCGYLYCIDTSVHRIVAKHFVDGRSKEKNQVNHKDGNKHNNYYTNLEWVSASENLTHSYKELKRAKNIGYQKYGRFKKIILNNQYEFKTLTALAKFLNVSLSQLYRYIDKETKNDYIFNFIF